MEKKSRWTDRTDRGASVPEEVEALSTWSDSGAAVIGPIGDGSGRPRDAAVRIESISCKFPSRMCMCLGSRNGGALNRLQQMLRSYKPCISKLLVILTSSVGGRVE
jgi:hypothetical protein